MDFQDSMDDIEQEPGSVRVDRAVAAYDDDNNDLTTTDGDDVEGKECDGGARDGLPCPTRCDAPCQKSDGSTKIQSLKTMATMMSWIPWCHACHRLPACNPAVPVPCRSTSFHAHQVQIGKTLHCRES